MGPLNYMLTHHSGTFLRQGRQTKMTELFIYILKDVGLGGGWMLILFKDVLWEKNKLNDT